MIKSGYNMATIPDKRPGMFQRRSGFCLSLPTRNSMWIVLFQLRDSVLCFGEGGGGDPWVLFCLVSKGRLSRCLLICR